MINIIDNIKRYYVIKYYFNKNYDNLPRYKKSLRINQRRKIENKNLTFIEAIELAKKLNKSKYIAGIFITEVLDPYFKQSKL